MSQNLIRVLDFPINAKQKRTLYVHPLRKLHYNKTDICNANKILSKPLIEPGFSENKYRECADELKYKILSDWKDNGVAYNCLLRSFDLLESLHPLQKRRSDTTPRLFHFLIPAFKLSYQHADADAVIATLHHDDFEDGFCTSKNLRAALLGNNPTEKTSTLVDCVLWHVSALTNYYKSNLVKAKLISPSDWKKPDVYKYICGRILAEDYYLRSINSLPIADPRVIKISGDRLNNIQSVLDPKQNLEKMFYCILKVFRSLSWAKKFHYATYYYTLDFLEKSLKRIESVYPSAREDFSISKSMDVKIPINMYQMLDYHKNTNSFEQDEHEKNIVELAGIREELSADTMRKLPYVGSLVAVLFCPPKSYFSRIDIHPYELQLPKRIGHGDPSNPKNFEQLRSEDILDSLQNVFNSNGLNFNLQIIPSILPAKMGVDTLMLRLNYNNQSLVDDLNKLSNPLFEYQQLTQKICIAVSNFVLNEYSSVLNNSSQKKNPTKIES